MTDNTNSAAFAKAAKAFEDAPRKMQLAAGRSLRAQARPLGDAMVAGLAARMPRRGGLSARVAASKVTVSATVSGANPRVAITLANEQKYRLGRLNSGAVRHPVFGHRNAWAQQSVPANGATEVFNAAAPKFRASLTRDLQASLDETAREGS